jgi:hypothetical protein
MLTAYLTHCLAYIHVTSAPRIKTVNALYSYPYLNQQNPLFLPVIAYTLSTTKLEIRAK